jgi:4-hydroxy-3-polyprenylbenzoate decarboxylase
MNQKPKRIILAITGASGAILGIRTLELLKEVGVETHLVISRAARRTITSETDWKIKDVEALASACYDPGDIGARIASGSFVTDGMLVVPCSIKSLSGIANSYAENLVVRAADVCMKEGRKLILAVRETPLHPGHLQLMHQAADAGAVIFPPVPAFYGDTQTVDDLLNNLAGRILLRMGIENDHYHQWDGG